MCGVNFIFGKGLSKSTLNKSIFQMIKANKHRGPDSTELLIDKNFAFGFNRLSIVGGAKGKQPIYDRVRNLVLVCNGEIFNYKDIQGKFFAKDKYIGTSDVEVIIHLYDKFGISGIKYLEGQFSFILLDLEKQKIYLGRDKFGINPLFYYYDKNVLIVSSEIKSLISSNLITKLSLNKNALIESLLFYGPLDKNTTFSRIFQVTPASYVSFNNFDNKIISKKYWSLIESKKKIYDINYAKLKMNKLLFESVARRLIGDSLPGVYLSGGLDSSIIAYLVSQIVKKKAVLFGITFQNKKYDESIYQKIIARKLGLKLIQVYVSNKVIVKTLYKCVFHSESPLIRTAPIPLLLLSKAVREENIKFVLCGEGADEMFGGYPVFLKNKSSIEEKWNTLSNYLDIFKGGKTKVYAEKSYRKILSIRKDSTLFRARKLEIDTKLSRYLLTNQGDRMSMANGVEQRFPFLDGQIIKLAFAIDKKLLLGNDEEKALLKAAFKEKIPSVIIKRKKQGYLAPDKEVVLALLEQLTIKKILSKEYFRKVKIFQYNKFVELINVVRNDSSVNDFDYNILLFIITTHLLHFIFLNSKSIKDIV